MTTTQVHKNQPILHHGPALDQTSRAVILLHGRGSSARTMIPLAEELSVEGVSFLIPQAANSRWYPETAFGPLKNNQPDLSSALQRISEIIQKVNAVGIPRERVYLGGFSQGACLAAEYTARNAARYGGLFVLSGALIGPPDTPQEYPGSLQGTPVFIGCSDVDPWIPQALVQQTGEVLQTLNGRVDLRLYGGMGHTINREEILAVGNMLQAEIRE